MYMLDATKRDYSFAWMRSVFSLVCKSLDAVGNTCAGSMDVYGRCHPAGMVAVGTTWFQ